MLKGYSKRRRFDNSAYYCGFELFYWAERMSRMIITSSPKLEVGKIYKEGDNGCYFMEVDGVRHTEFRFLVLRECTKQDYYDHIKEEYGAMPEDSLIWEFFYEISMD